MHHRSVQLPRRLFPVSRDSRNPGLKEGRKGQEREKEEGEESKL
jgi:hypothetical protein